MKKLLLLAMPFAFLACNRAEDAQTKDAANSSSDASASSLKSFCATRPDAFYENCENFVKSEIFEEKFGIKSEFKVMAGLVKQVGAFTFPRNADSQQASDACTAFESLVTKRNSLRVRDMDLLETDNLDPLCHFYQKVAITWFDGRVSSRVAGASGNPNQSVTGSNANMNDNSKRADMNDYSGGDATNIIRSRLDGAPVPTNASRCSITNHTGSSVTLSSLSYEYRCPNGTTGTKTDNNSVSIFHGTSKDIAISAPCLGAVATSCSAEYVEK